MAAVRLWTWIICGLAAVYISANKSFVHSIQLLLGACHVPTWIVLLPVSLTASWFMAQTVLYFIGLPRVSPNGKAIFITGCDSGFGNVLAKRMASNGYKVFAGCLFPDGDGAKQLLKSSKSDGGGISVVPCDVTNEQSLADAVDVVTQQLGEKLVLWAVVANAGIAIHGYLEWSTIESVQKLFDVNTFGVMRTFKAFAPLLRKARGRLVVTTSLAARFATPPIVPYAMSKHASLALCDGLRAELAPFGIHVVSIEPNGYRTNIIPTTAEELDIQWESLTEEQRQSYGPKLLRRSHRMVRDFWSLCQRDLAFPIWCFEHAITAMYPKNNYQADRLFSLGLGKLLLILPYEFIGLVHEYFHRIMRTASNRHSGKDEP